ncbi:MAG: hypothetical protein C0467_04300 [Planctomycetaceae bacterium]|nr:hypothetical protein [Planctomycetaceae bacterium]
MTLLLHDILGNPFQPLNPPWLMSEEGSKVRDWPQFANLRFKPEWLTADAVAIAKQMYESRDFSAMPILADALQDAGCDNDDILNHCRDANGVHVGGCWVVDLVLNKM